MASLAGGWSALVAGFGGMRARAHQLTFAPRLPPGISRLSFRVRYRGRRLVVVAGRDEATYELREGPPITIVSHGERLELGDEVVRQAIPMIPRKPRPVQPPGREPRPRSPHLALAVQPDQAEQSA
jgi:alpha,alpha-trehalose phosphorylase